VREVQIEALATLLDIVGKGVRAEVQDYVITWTRFGHIIKSITKTGATAGRTRYNRDN